jgi:cyclopropane fatty-acyl-phospholipid synthase-like methyltransferase
MNTSTQESGLAEIKPGMQVLDLNCQPSGRCLEAARQVGPGGLVIGVNASLEVLDQTWHRAQAEGLKNLYLVQYDPKAFVLDEPVDLVLAPDRGARGALLG